jgi:hypothetical protein
VEVQVRAEYACGHAGRVIFSGCSGRCRPRKLSADLRRLIAAVIEGNEVDFKCPCGREAAFVEIVLDGKIIHRQPASAFRNVPGARLTGRKA